MNKIKTFGSLFLAMISTFTLGAYTYASTRGLEVVESHRWFLTSMFGLMFLLFFLIDYRKKIKI